MKKSWKNIIKNLAKVTVVLWGLVLWWYHFSEKIGYMKHDVQKELKDNLWKKEILKDQETNDIIKLMSGMINQQEFDSMLARHGYVNDTIKINTLIHADEAMYKTILEMQTKYGNPKISFWGSFENLETGKNEPTRARFNFHTNTIKSHQLDSVMIKFDDIQKNESLWLDYGSGIWWLHGWTRQEYLLNNWIAEIAHAKQLKEMGLIKKSIDGTIDYLRSGFNYENTYEIPWTQEYQAHKEYEPQLAKEFIDIYKKYVKDYSDLALWNLAKFNAWFFEKYNNEKQSYNYLHMLKKRKNPDAIYFLAKLYTDEYGRNFVSWWHSISTDTTSTKIIFWKKYTANILFNEMLNLYKEAYSLWKTDAGFNLVQIAFNYKRWEYNDLIITIGNDLLKNHKQEMTKLQLANICSKIWSVYYQQKDLENGAKYMKMVDEFSWWEDIRWY